VNLMIAVDAGQSQLSAITTLLKFGSPPLNSQIGPEESTLNLGGRWLVGQTRRGFRCIFQLLSLANPSTFYQPDWFWPKFRFDHPLLPQRG
jgi:hypothetical protein